ncbi:MAG: VOC family protein [Clostridia bacterium]|nr:VOC family protein [Clostridia bacterium]
MIFEGICLITNDVKRLSEFYQKVLQTTSDSDDDIHQEIKTRGAFLSILYCEQATKGNPYMSMAFTVDDVDDEFVRLKRLGIKIIDEPTMRPWGAKNMRFCDPDGNFVVFRSFPKKT